MAKCSNGPCVPSDVREGWSRVVVGLSFMFSTNSGVNSGGVEYASRSSPLGCGDIAGTSLSTSLLAWLGGLRISSVIKGCVPLVNDCCWVSVAERLGLAWLGAIALFLHLFPTQVGHKLTNSAVMCFGSHEKFALTISCVRSLPP